MLRSWPVLQTNSRTSSRSSIHRVTSHENFPHVRSASAAPARYAPTRSSAPCTTPESAGSSAPARCRNESPQALPAPPRSAPARASLSGSQNSYPLPAPNTLACTRRSRLARGTSARSPRHRARNPAPIRGLLPSPHLAPFRIGAGWPVPSSHFRPLGKR